MKPEKHRSNIIEKVLASRTPEEILNASVRVSIEIGMIDMLTKAGYRPDKTWSEDEDEQLSTLMNCAKDIAKDCIKSAKEYHKSKTQQK